MFIDVSWEPLKSEFLEVPSYKNFVERQQVPKKC